MNSQGQFENLSKIAVMQFAKDSAGCGTGDLAYDLADAIIADGYMKPRVVESRGELYKLRYGTALQTSDATDTVVLKDTEHFRNQSGFEVSVEDLWNYGLKPFTVLWEPTA